MLLLIFPLAFCLSALICIGSVLYYIFFFLDVRHVETCREALAASSSLREMPNLNLFLHSYLAEQKIGAGHARAVPRAWGVRHGAAQGGTDIKSKSMNNSRFDMLYNSSVPTKSTVKPFNTLKRRRGIDSEKILMIPQK